MFPELVFVVAVVLPKAEPPPKIDPPAAEGLVTDPKRPPPLVAPVLPKMLEAVVAGATAAPNGLDGCCEPAVEPPKIEPVLEGGELGATDPNKPVPPEVLPKGELVAPVVPKIDPPEAALLVATDPKRPVPAVLLAPVTTAADDPKMDVGLDVSVVAVAVPKAEVAPEALSPKIDAVSVFDVVNEPLPKMFPAGLSVA